MIEILIFIYLGLVKVVETLNLFRSLFHSPFLVQENLCECFE